MGYIIALVVGLISGLVAWIINERNKRRAAESAAARAKTKARNQNHVSSIKQANDMVKDSRKRYEDVRNKFLERSPDELFEEYINRIADVDPERAERLREIKRIADKRRVKRMQAKLLRDNRKK